MANPLSGIWQPSITTEPPTQREIHRNDLALLGFVLLMLLLGWLVSMAVKEEVRTYALAADLPTIVYPEGWVVTGTTTDTLFMARNPASPSAFDSEISVEGLPVREGESLETLRVILSLRRNQELEHYREIDAQRVLVNGDTHGYLVTYAFIADPSRESGAPGLPVVVEGQDLIFGSGNKWLAVTTRSDASQWDSESAPFAALHEHLRVQPAVLVEVTPAGEDATGEEPAGVATEEANP